MRKLRIGIAGFGGIGHLHAAIYQKLPHCELVAVADPDPAKLAAETGDINLGIVSRVDLASLRRYADAEEMLAQEQLDYLDVALPTDLHEAYAVRALEAGLHVFCEKPMARSTAAARRMLEASRRSRRELMIGQCLRFWPCYEVLKEAVDSGRYGNLRMLSLSRISVISSKAWMFDGKRSGGAAWDLHMHDADFLNYLLGVPRGVTATGTGRHTGAIDNIHALYRYGGQVTVFAEASWGATAFSMRYQAIFENAVLETARNGAEVILRRVGVPDRTLTPEPGNGHERELAYYTRRLLDGKRPERCLPESTLESLRMVEAEIASAEKNGVWVTL